MKDQLDPAPLRVAFHTQGCRLNQYDTEVIRDAMERLLPVIEVPWESDADLYVLNSCTVTGKAAQACRRLARQVKHRHPDARVVVAGCYAQTEPAALAALPEVDAVVGNTLKDQVDRWLPDVLAGTDQPVMVEPFGPRQPLSNPAISTFGGRTRAHVKVQDGCDLRCAYCKIWQARGPARSRPAAAVLDQVRLLHGTGYRELVLTGVHLGAWGQDLTGEPGDLCDLLALLCRELPGSRLRLSSLHPDEVTPRLLDLMAAAAPLQPHLHLSLQSGSDAVLQRMHRPYSAHQAFAVAAGLAGVDPACGLGADLIVGFPGESEAEFTATLDLVDALPISYLHVFRFSARPGTPAAAMTPVASEVITRRAASLRALGRRKRAAFEERLLGQCRPGVLERPAPTDGNRRRATLDNFVAVTLDSELAAGTVVEVRLEAQRQGRLEGRLVRVVEEVSA